MSSAFGAFAGAGFHTATCNSAGAPGGRENGSLVGVAHVVNEHNGGDAAAEQAARLDGLVSDWVSVPELAELQGVKLSEVRRQIKDGELVAVRRGPNSATYVPGAFLVDGAPHPRLKGTFTVLRDGGMNDPEIVEWLFTPDAGFRADGSAMGALLAGFVTEVRRRAMETAF